MKKTLWILAVLVGALLILWVYSKDSSEVEVKPIKIGAVLGITGSAKAWSEFQKKGLDLAIEEVNVSGGVDGRPLEIIYEDSKTNPADGVSALRKLVELDKVEVVVGDVWSFTTNPLIPIANSYKKVLISPTVMDKSVEGSSDYFFTLGHTIESQEKATNKFFEINPDVKTVSILCWDDAWGKANLDLWKKVISEKKLKIVSEECNANYSNDYRTEISKIKSKNPDAVLIGVSSGVIRPVLQRIQEFGIKSKLLGQNTVEEAFRVDNLPTTLAKNLWFVNWQSSNDFISKFENKYGSYPLIEAQNSYEVIRSIALALKSNTDLVGALKNVKYQSVDGFVDFTGGDHNSVNKAEARLFKVSETGQFIEQK